MWNCITNITVQIAILIFAVDDTHLQNCGVITCRRDDNKATDLPKNRTCNFVSTLSIERKYEPKHERPSSRKKTR